MTLREAVGAVGREVSHRGQAGLYFVEVCEELVGTGCRKHRRYLAKLVDVEGRNERRVHLREVRLLSCRKGATLTPLKVPAGEARVELLHKLRDLRKVTVQVVEYGLVYHGAKEEALYEKLLCVLLGRPPHKRELEIVLDRQSALEYDRFLDASFPVPALA